jgi:predicted nucleic acid-binding protein
MILVDTSVWIEALRRGRALHLEELVDFDEIVICLPILQELLQGFRDERAFRIARESLTALPTIESPLRQEVFEEAANLYRSARRNGLAVRSSMDCLIAACAIRHGLTVLHRDRDFPVLARVSALQQRAV